MRHVFCFLFALVFLNLYSSAQPTLTAATTNPVAYEKPSYLGISTQTGSGTNPGAAGANVTWDFSRLSSPQFSTTGRYTPCASSPACSSFPNSTFELTDSGAGGKTFIIANTMNYALNGIRTGTGIGNADYVYTDPRLILHYPFTYTDSFVDSFSGSITGSFPGSLKGYNTVIADGYGTLITPLGIYMNVLRVQTVSFEKDSLHANGVAYTTGESKYDWYSQDFHEVVFSINTVTRNGAQLYCVTSWRNQANVGIVKSDAAGSRFSISPTPARTFLAVKSKTGIPYRYQLSDVNGRVVTNAEGDGDLQINVETLARGLYFFKAIVGGDEVFVTKVMLE